MKELQLQLRGLIRLTAEYAPITPQDHTKRTIKERNSSSSTNIEQTCVDLMDILRSTKFNTEKMSEGAQFSSLLKYPTYMAVLAAHLLFIYCFQNKKTRSNSNLKLLSY